MKMVKIRRVASISRDEFVREHASGLGLPVIVSGFARTLPAGAKWSFAYFKENFANDFAIVPVDPFFGNSGFGGKVTRIGDYIDFMDGPLDDVPGFWIDAQKKPLRDPPIFDRAMAWNLDWRAFSHHPELVNDIMPYPEFIPDYLKQLSEPVRKIFKNTMGIDFRSLYIGPKGTTTNLHQDFSYTHGCLTQIVGKKKVVLFSPEDSDKLYYGDFEVSDPDFEKNPLLNKTTAYEGVLEPGDLIFIPAQWWHYTEIIEKSITLSYNFFNEYNVRDYLSDIFRDTSKLADYLNSKYSSSE